MIAGGNSCVCTCDSSDMLREKVLANDKKQCEMRCLPNTYKCDNVRGAIPIMPVLSIVQYDNEYVDYDFGGF